MWFDGQCAGVEVGACRRVCHLGLGRTSVPPSAPAACRALPCRPVNYEEAHQRILLPSSVTECRTQHAALVFHALEFLLDELEECLYVRPGVITVQVVRSSPSQTRGDGAISPTSAQ